jgi:hypothetical protein
MSDLSVRNGVQHGLGRDQHGKTVKCIGSSPEDVLRDAESEALPLSDGNVVPIG